MSRSFAAILCTTLALSAAAKAEQFPLRDPGPYRTAFVEAATKACNRYNELPDGLESRVTVAQFCDCKVAMFATFARESLIQEAAKGGMFVTPRYQALADWAEDGCVGAFTGRPAKALP